MSAAPPSLARFCKVKQHPRKLALFTEEYKLRCRDYALEKLANGNYSIAKARMLLVVAKVQKRAVDALTPQDELGKKKGFVARNKAAATLELLALEAAVRKHVNQKKNKSVNRRQQRPPRGAAGRTGPETSGRSTEALTRENARLKQEAASLRNSVADLRRDLYQARQVVDPIQQFITYTLEEARKFASNEHEWHQIQKRLWLSFHPDKNLCKETAHRTRTAMQNHHLYHW